MSAIYGTLDRVVWGFSPAIFKRLKWLKQCDWLSIVASSTGLVFVDSVGFSTAGEVGKGDSGSFDELALWAVIGMVENSEREGIVELAIGLVDMLERTFVDWESTVDWESKLDVVAIEDALLDILVAVGLLLVELASDEVFEIAVEGFGALDVAAGRFEAFDVVVGHSEAFVVVGGGFAVIEVVAGLEVAFDLGIPFDLSCLVCWFVLATLI